MLGGGGGGDVGLGCGIGRGRGSCYADDTSTGIMLRGRNATEFPDK